MSQRLNQMLDDLDAAEGLAPEDPYAQEALQYGGQAEPGGVLSDFLAGAGEYIGRRIKPFVPGFPALTAPDTTAASLGAAAVPTAVSFALPGSGLAGMAAQGGLSAVSEALDPRSTAGSILSQGVLGSVFTGVADVSARAARGMAGRVMDAITDAGGKARQTIQRTESQRLRTMAETLGGLGAFNTAQQRQITRAAVEAIGESGDTFSREIRRNAARRIGTVMDDALPTSPVDVTEAFTLLDDIPADVLPGKSRLRTLISTAENNPRAYQDAARQLRETARSIARSPNAVWAQEVLRSLDSLTAAGEAAGAVSTKAAREQWKNLVSLESVAAVRRTGQVPALSTEGALFRSYGPSVSRGERAHLEPATQRMFSMMDSAAEELAQRFRSSGTAERTVGAEAVQDVMGMLSGTTSPSSLMRTLGSVTLAGPFLGAASMAKPVPGAGQAGAGVERLLDEDLRRE